MKIKSYKQARSIVAVMIGIVTFFATGVNESLLLVSYGLLVFIWDHFIKNKHDFWKNFLMIFIPFSILKIICLWLLYSFSWRAITLQWIIFLLFYISLFLTSKESNE